MAYSNFKPLIWSKKIQNELDKLMIFKDICNTNFQGEAGRGKTVKIIGASRPTIKTYTPGTNMDAAETPPDTSVMLAIDQYKYFNVSVDDVDQAQADLKILNAYTTNGAKALAEDADTYIATLVGGNDNKITKTTAVTTAELAKAAIREAFVKLWDAGVKIGPDTYIGITPWFYDLFKEALQSDLTTNVEMITKGIVGMYNGAKVMLSNNIYNDGAYDNIFVASKDAITYADGMNETEAYRPDLAFQDAVKSLHTYGAKIVRPKEIVTIKVKKA